MCVRVLGGQRPVGGFRVLKELGIRLRKFHEKISGVNLRRTSPGAEGGKNLTWLGNKAASLQGGSGGTPTY